MPMASPKISTIPFPDVVTAETRQPGKLLGIGSAYVAAKFLLEEWPVDEGLKLSIAKQILLKCRSGKSSAAVARVAFVEAAREADIFVEMPKRPSPTGKLTRWHKGRTKRRSKLKPRYPPFDARRGAHL
jgi:hypothetical protein